MTTLEDTLAQNLHQLCDFYPSIAEICRRLRINRQQFNKYLSGQIRPSAHNMRRICDFFGVTESEMLLQPDHFAQIVSPRRSQPDGAGLSEPLKHIEALFDQSNSLERYVGYYYRYFYSFGYPGYIMKSLASLYESDGRYYWKNIEILRSDHPGRRSSVSKYTGAVFLLADRIFIVEYESVLRNSITQAILYPSYHNKVLFLNGVQTGASTMRGRKPSASIVLLEYLGQDISLRKAMRSSGLYTEDDPAIDPTIRRLIENPVVGGAYVLETEETV